MTGKYLGGCPTLHPVTPYSLARDAWQTFRTYVYPNLFVTRRFGPGVSSEVKGWVPRIRVGLVLVLGLGVSVRVRG